MATPRQILANRLNAAKSRGPKTEKGKARSRMNALRHGLAAVTINESIGPFKGDAPLLDEIHQRLRQIDIERANVFNQISDSLALTELGIFDKRLRQLAALERYAQRAHSKLKKPLG